MSDSDISDNQGLPLVRPKIVPPLDAVFRPAALANRFFRKAASQSDKTTRVQISVERSPTSITRYQTHVLSEDHPQEEANFIYLQRLLKCLLWSKGGHRIHLDAPAALVQKLQKFYKSTATGKFDAKFMGDRVYGQPFEILQADSESLPEEQHEATPLGRHWNGCRIGFDLGASDRKVAAVQDGKVVFSDEFPWNPVEQKDPQWHFDQINDMLKEAAKHLPRVDAIGGSSAGVFVDSQARVASLFRGVSDDDFKERIRPLFQDIRKDWGDIPVDVVNDGEVTALAGSMSLETNSILGLALGSSLASGYVDPSGFITDWINELAFAPIDYHPDAAVDEWSGDYGCGVQYFSQQAVGRLLPASGLDIDEGLTLPEKLVGVQEAMKEGDERAEAIYRTIGIYLGYTLPHYAEFYEFNHLLILGRVTTGDGGSIIMNQADQVLQEEFPEFPLKFHVPNEKEKRHGQAMAAASLPVIPEPS